MVQYFPVVTGSLTVTGSINVSGGITASGGISISGSIASASFASTASFVALAQSASNAVAAATASFANAFTVAGNLTAQTLVVQTITSSVDFVTGSTRFGSIIGNTHVFTGSMAISGGLVVTTTAPELTVGATGVTLGNILTDAHIISGSLTVNPGGLFVSSSGLIGINTTNPTSRLHIINNTDGFVGRFTGGAASTVTAGIFANSTTGFASIGVQSNHQFRLFTNDADRLTVGTDGSVGIGTTNPLAQLHIYNGGNTARFRMEAGATGAALLDFYSGSTARWSIGIDNTQAYGKLENRVLAIDAIRFYDSSNNVVLVPSSGNVFIAGTSQLGSSKLSVFGPIAARNSGVDGTYAEAFTSYYSANNTESNSILTAVSSAGGQSGFRFDVSNGALSANRTTMMTLTRSNLSVSNEIIIGAQGGTDITYISGGSGYGSIIQNRYAGGSVNNEIRGNGNNYFNAVLGSLGIGTSSPGFKLDVLQGSPDIFRVTNNGSATGNNPAAQFFHTHGNHSWGIVAEFRVGSSGGTDSSSIMFSQGYNTNTWAIGFGYNDTTNFRINRDQGPYGGGWGTTLFSMDRNGNYSFAGSNVSDRRNKKDIAYITDSQLETISKLKPASFNKKSPGKNEYSDHIHTGFIAQDILEENIPNLVHGNETDGYGLDYDGVLALTVKALQELNTKFEEYKATHP